MSKLTTGSFSIEDLESVQITINNIVGAAKEAAERKGKRRTWPDGSDSLPFNCYIKGLEFYTVRPL